MVSDYKDFIEANGQTPPTQLDQIILKKVRKDLDPFKKIIFAKMIAVQSFVSFLTLLFCPQFNFSLTNSYSVFHLIHQTFGHHICMVVCGSIFLGSGALFAALILNRYEIRAIGRSHFLFFIAMTGIAVALFMFIGTDLYIDMTALWSFGAIASSVLLFEGGKLLKIKLQAH